MNFKKIKTIFIALFFLTNLFLIINIVCNSYENSTVNKALIEQVCQVLKNNSIDADVSVIPDKKIVLPRLMTVNSSDTERKIATDLLGRRFELKNIDGTDTYVFNTISLVLRNGNFIIFSCGKNDDYANMDQKAAQDYVRRFMYRIDKKNSQFFIASSTESDGSYIFKVGQYYDNVLIDGSELIFNISKDGSISASGTYIYTNVRPLDSGAVSDPLNAALKFINYNTQGTKIQSMEACYLISKNVLNTTMIPAYKITNEKGISFYLDIVTGQKIK